MSFEKTIPEIMQEIKRNHTADIMGAITEPDKSGRGYVCPICGSGTGKNGTGLTAGTKNPDFFQCWACGFKGDVFDLLQATTRKSEAVELVQEAERILHRQFLGDNKNNVNFRKETPKKADTVNKNMVQNNDNKSKNLLEMAKEKAEKTAKARAIMEYIKKGHEALPASPDGLAYLQGRGISEKTAMRYNLGFVANYGDGMNAPAVIIPTGKYSYTARSIEAVEKGRKYRKKNAGEKQGIFNIDALREPGAVIFLVEGEFDALSIIEAGFVAIATGGGTSETELVKAIAEAKTRPEKFVILPDNDRKDDGTPDEEKGFIKGLKLADALKAAGVAGKIIDTRNWNPDIKDCNDFLIKDRAGFVSLLQGIAEPIRQEALRTLGRASDYVQNFIDHIGGKTAPVDTGFKVVNDLLDGGLHPGLIVIGAISSLGKTTFLLNIADNMASRGQEVIIFSLEMSKYELMAKSVSRKTFEYCKAKKQPITNARTNLGISDYDRYQFYSDSVMNMIDECVQSYETYIANNLYLVEGVGNIGVEQIREHVRRHIAVTKKLPVVIIDYMQILAPADARSSDKQNTDRAVVELKRISRDFNIPVIGISSFNRDSYSEPVSMKAFKESGAIEYTSDVLIGLQYAGMDYEMYENEKEKIVWETEKDGRRHKRISELFANNEAKANAGDGIDIDIKILKNRSGAKGKKIIKYYPKFNCYREE